MRKISFLLLLALAACSKPQIADPRIELPPIPAELMQSPEKLKVIDEK